MASIYEIDNYDTGGNSYVKNDVVAGYGAGGTTLGRFYYNLGNTPTNAAAPEAAGGDAYWADIRPTTTPQSPIFSGCQITEQAFRQSLRWTLFNSVMDMNKEPHKTSAQTC